jgi:NAD(P)H-hydrate epimerase
MPGAAALTANAAIKSGAGLVYLMTPKIHPSIRPEIIPTLLPTDNFGYVSYLAKEMILEASQKADVIVFGPGLGFTDEMKQLISELLNELPEDLSILLDADAIKSIDAGRKYKRNLIITPHIGEFSILSGIPREEIYDNHSFLAEEWAQKLNCTILLKHIPSIITDGGFTVWNLGGNPGMSTAGSGDVLTGIICSLLGQGLEPLEAASVGAYLHSKAGDNYAEKYSESSLTASDIINELDNVFKEYEN